MDDDLLREFVSESREHLTTIEADLLQIEEGGADIDETLVNKVFRAAHSIKGGSGFFGLTRVKELAHKAETVLDMIRSRQMSPNAEITNILLATFDRLREMINDPDASETADTTDLLASLTGLASSYLPTEKKASLTQTISLQPDRSVPPVSFPQVDFDRAKRDGKYIYSIEYDLIHDIERQGKNVLEVFRDLRETGEILDCALDFEAAGTLDDPIGNFLPLKLVFATILRPDDIGIIFPMEREKITVLYDSDAPESAPVFPEPISSPVPDELPVISEPIPVIDPFQAGPIIGNAMPSAPQKAAAPQRPVSASAPTTTIEDTLRVNVGLLETLMNLAGELVLSRNQLRAAIAQNNAQSLSIADQRVNQVTSELQDAIMQTRLQPVGNVFAKFPRVVRDMANALGKDIQLDIRGKDVALDKSLIEGLSDPLTHMVRNAVDHGIEMPEDRIRSGKKGSGLIRIEARHEAGQVLVEIADDGKGIDPHRIARSALSKGLITEDKLLGMSDAEKSALIFLPGLSTAESVSDISGRGVGMDVVKTNLDRLGGKVEITSEPGKGTNFRIKLPLTLAIIPSLIVSVENERFAIPQINVEELLRIRAEDIKKRIEVVGDAEVLLLRDRIIPLVHFADLLGVTPTYIDPVTQKREVDRRVNLADRRSPRHPAKRETLPAASDSPSSSSSRSGRRYNPNSALEIAVVATGVVSYGLVVSAFHNTEEIVVKPLGGDLKTLTEYAGATILGDGAVALILDVAGLAAKANLAMVSGTDRARDLADEVDRERLQDQLSLLTFHNADDEWCAVPLGIIQRIERITPSQVEMAAGKRTMQYRGSSLPLVTLSDVAKVKSMNGATDLAVIVSSVHGHEVGLLGAMPVDVIETRAVIDQVTHRQKGIAGSTLINNRTTLIADIFEVVDAVYPEWGIMKAASRSADSESKSATVLLAEDSNFFREQVKRFLVEDGYDVLDAPDGEAAWQSLVANLNKVGIVVTDIEMPKLSGLGLAQRIRSDSRTTNLPIIAVTSLAGEEDLAKGRAVGINDYQVKLDRDQLLETIHSWLAR